MESREGSPSSVRALQRSLQMVAVAVEAGGTVSLARVVVAREAGPFLRQVGTWAERGHKVTPVATVVVLMLAPVVVVVLEAPE